MIAGAAYRTSNEQIRYPFIDSAPLTAPGAGVHGAAARLPLDALVDAVFLVPPGVLTVALARAEYTGATTRALYLVDQDADALGTLVVDTTDARRFPELQVRDSATGVTIRVVAGAALVAYLLGTADGVDDVFDGLVFDATTVESAGLGVRTLGTSTTAVGSETPGALSGGGVTLIEGYNVALDADTEARELTIAVSPGSGRGLAPCHDDDEDTPLPFNALRPDESGAIQIEGEDCYSAQPVDDQTIMIHGVCKACCSCDDTVAMAERAKAAVSRVRALRARYDAVRGLLAEQITSFNAYVTGVDQPALPAHGEVVAAVTCSAQPRSGSPRTATLTFQIDVRNLRYVECDVRITMTPGSMSEPAGGVIMSMTGENTGHPVDKWWTRGTDGLAMLGWTLNTVTHTGGGSGTFFLPPRSYSRVLLRYTAALGAEPEWHPTWAVDLFVVGSTDAPIGVNPQPILWTGMPNSTSIRVDRS